MYRKNNKASPADYMRFAQFNKTCIHKEINFYLFFTSGLLMFLLRCLEFVPPHVNTVLLGANLQEFEIQYVRKNLSYPLFVIEQDGITDQGILDILLRTHTSNFGYMDVDTFVFNPELFEKMAEIPSDAIINCYRQYHLTGSTKVCETNFMYFNAKNVTLINASPFSYSYRRTEEGPEYITDDLYKKICSLVPYGQYPYGTCYDTLILFQLLAISQGLRINCVQNIQTPENMDAQNFIHMGQSHFISCIYQAGGLPKGYPNALHYIKVVIIALKLLRHRCNSLPVEYEELEQILTNLIYSEPYRVVTCRIEKNLRLRKLSKADTTRIIKE